MPGEDQERFEDYLELEQFIAEIQAGHVTHPPQNLTPAQARIYRMALLFHAATPGVSQPDPEFAAQLEARLEEELLMQEDTQEIRTVKAHTPPAPAPTKPRKRQLPRRSLLTGGAIAAASALVGVGVEAMRERVMDDRNGVIHLTGISTATDWFPVMNVAELGNQAVKFVSDLVVGYIVRSDGTNGDPTKRGQILAMSAACTHKGCIVRWSNSERKYHCPCHDSVFNEDGGIDRQRSQIYLDPLPRLDVKVEDGKIYVRVPADRSPEA